MYYSDYQEDAVWGGYFPIHPTCTVANIRKIYVGINSTVARPGCYLQGAGTIRYGNYVQLAPNVGIRGIWWGLLMFSIQYALYKKLKGKFSMAKYLIG